MSAAQSYADAGLSPIKIGKADKRPFESGWQNAKIDAVAVDAWIARGGNVGLRMGEQPDGTLLVALDEDEPGALERAEATLGALPVTLTSRTGSGGQHRIFTWPASEPLPKGRVRALAGIDVRSQGGQIVVAPSVHPNGASYEWTHVAPCAELPEAWRVALLASGTPAAKAESASQATERVDRVVGVMYPHYAAGGRHDLTRALGGYLARYELGKWSDAEIRAVVERLPSDQIKKRVHDTLAAAERARTGAATPGWDVLRSRIGDEDADRLRLAARSDWWVRTAPVWERIATPEPDEAPAESAPDPGGQAFILVARNDPGHVLLWEYDKGHQPVATANLRLRVSELRIPVGLFEKGKALAPAAIIERQGKTFARAVYDFASRSSTYEPTEDRVIVGYPVNVPRGVHDVNVDAWLHALFGDAYERGTQWIASCAQQNIRRLAAALCLIGEKDAGKSLFADAVVGLWGEVEPPPAELIARQFNGDLARCPVVFDDEAQLTGSKTLSTKRFRELVQSTERSIERKGRERFQLRGAVRLIVACNGLEDLKFTDVTGPDVVDAVGDRLLVVNVKGRGARCRAALERLRVPGGWECDLPRIVGHFAWIAETVALPEERFIGHGNGAEAVLAGHAASEPALWDTLRAWIDAGNVKSPWCAHEGRLCVNAQKLAEWLDTTPGTRGQGWDVARVLRAIKPFSAGTVRPREGKERPRLWALDAKRVARATLDAEERAALETRL